MLRALVVLIVILSAAAGALIYSVVSRGLSAHDEPSTGSAARRRHAPLGYASSGAGAHRSCAAD